METKYYHLNEDIYVVTGACKHCIYDLKQGQLFSISEKTRQLIARAMAETNIKSILNQEERDLLDDLLNAELLVPANDPGNFPDIKLLKQTYPIKFSWIEVTRRCNLMCTFCYEESTPQCHERLSFESFKLVAKNLIDIGVSSIQFIGGEPLLIKDDLKKMIQYCRDDFSFIEVFSNGVLINDDWCQFFKEHNIHIAISIHSYIPEEHDKVVKQVGAFKKATRAVELLKKYEIPYRLATILTKDSKLGERKDSCLNLQPQPPRIAGRGDIAQYTLELFKMRAITKDNKRQSISKSQISKHVSGHQCFQKEIYVSATLDVYPCVMERRLSYGNLLQRKLSEIIDHELRFLTKDQVEGCRDCEFRYACFDCRPDSNGRGIYEKPWFCSYNPLTAKWSNLEELFHHLQQEAQLSSNTLQNIPIVVENHGSTRRL